MVDILFWIATGVLSGWIGYLASWTKGSDRVRPYLLVGVVGGVLGGTLTHETTATKGMLSLDPTSIFNALIASALMVTIFVVVTSFFGRASSS